MTKGLKNFKWGYAVIFLILSCVGALCIAFPETLKIVCIVSGIILALYSTILFTVTLARRERTTAFAFKIVIAGISLAAGIVMAILNQKSVGVLTSLLGLYMVIDGSFKLQTTVMSKRYKVAAWWIMLSLAIIVISGGFISLKWTPTADNAKWTSGLLGVTLIIDGIANLLTAFFTTAYEKRMIKEIKDDIEKETVSEDNNTADTRKEDSNKEENNNTETDSATKEEDPFIISIEEQECRCEADDK